MKTKKRLNSIDIIILILFAAALVSVAYYFINRGGMFTKYKYDIEYDIRVENLDSGLSNGISEGDTVRDKYTAFAIGSVERISTESIPDSKNAVNMVITVRARAEEHDGMLSVNGVTIAKGQNIFFRTPGLEYLGQCVDVTIAEREEK